jgi:hypothetical protein
MGSVVQQKRADAGADEAAADEAGERQGTHNEALGVTPDRHEERKGDNDPVDGGHGGGD